MIDIMGLIGFQIWYIPVALIVLVVLWFISKYNYLVRLREMYRNAKSQISPQLESRWDAVKTILDGVRKYSDYEKSTLESVIEKRRPITPQSSVSEMQEDDRMFEKALGAINVVVERYPDLKASPLYAKAMDEIHYYEENVRHARMILQDAATKYNIGLMTFPTSIVGSMFNFEKGEYFTHTESKSEPPQWN